MIHSRIKADAPFGEDEDANNAVRTFAPVAGLLAQETQKLAAMKTSNLNLRVAQEGRVSDLRSEMVSRASAVHVDPDEFLAACIKHLSKRGGKPLAAIPALSRAPIDGEDRRLQEQVLDAELAEADRKRRLDTAQGRYDAAVTATQVARARLAAHRAAARMAA